MVNIYVPVLSLYKLLLLLVKNEDFPRMFVGGDCSFIFFFHPDSK